MMSSFHLSLSLATMRSCYLAALALLAVALCALLPSVAAADNSNAMYASALTMQVHTMTCTAEFSGPILLASALTVTCTDAAALRQIEPREEQCFYEDLKKDQQFRLEFEVVRGGLLDCKIRISDPNKVAVVERMAYFNKEVTRHTHARAWRSRRRARSVRARTRADRLHLCVSALCVCVLPRPTPRTRLRVA